MDANDSVNDSANDLATDLRPAVRPSYTLIRDLPQDERPRERLHHYGAAALSVPELLAILLRVGRQGESAISMAQRILRDCGGIAGLGRASVSELCAIDGLGPAKAAQLKAAIELGHRLAKEELGARPILRTPDDIYQLVGAELSLLDQEEVRVVTLNTRNEVMAEQKMYRGSAHTTQVRVGELLSEAVRQKATAIVLVHNHPSGDPTPSAADGKLTAELYQACKLMDIALHDHVIVGGGRYVSLRNVGLGFPKDAMA